MPPWMQFFSGKVCFIGWAFWRLACSELDWIGGYEYGHCSGRSIMITLGVGAFFVTNTTNLLFAKTKPNVLLFCARPFVALVRKCEDAAANQFTRPAGDECSTLAGATATALSPACQEDGDKQAHDDMWP